MADYIHTTVLFAIILAFMFSVYVTSDQIGSPGKVRRRALSDRESRH